ncbi:MAG: hypothetical protein IPM69_14940 [Ignavibacteria bacterium]|nr:hypothetical protein [Ignavibacteria bacterium]
MQLLNLKSFAFLCFVIIVLTCGLFSRCGKNQQTQLVTETIRWKDLPPAPALFVHDSIKVKVKTYIPNTVRDTAEIQRLMVERDSLTRELDSQYVRITFSTDTIHTSTHDTFRVECDELKHHINYSINYAPRQEKTIIRTETFLEELTFWDKFRYSLLGAAVVETLHLLIGIGK